ncbi:MAG: DNA-protecting protein DprA [Pseudomonadota bacterium]|jgi:DNA processing protein
MNTSHPYAAWLRLSLCPKLPPSQARALLAQFGLPENIFAASAASLSSVIGMPLAEHLLAYDSKAAIDTALEWSAQPGNHLISLADESYPKSLLDIPDPPALIYAKGQIGLLNQTAIAVVGSRNATAGGLGHAEAFSETLSQAGITIVSGLALGIDAAAHKGALRGRGSTIAVIGTGADRMYPARNEALARQIAQDGLIISDYALGTPALAANFPRRNRLVSGLSRGVLVVEAALKSGSLITARLAAEQGRDVFAIPGSIHSPLAKGCHQLIKQGAKLVDDAADIITELGLIEPPVKAAQSVADLPRGTPESDVLSQMGFDPCGMDILATRTGLTPEALYAILVTLELEGRVATLPGGHYQRLR